MLGINCYSAHVVYKDTMIESGASEVSAIKNIFSCEAHNELITNSLKIIYEGKLKEAEEKICKIEMLQNMQIPEY